MKRTIVGTALLIAAGAVANAPAHGQRIAVDLSWHRGNGAPVYGPQGSYRRGGYLQCEPQGRYLYCWDRQSYRPGRAMAVHVFHRRAAAGRQYTGREYNRHRPARSRDWRTMSQREYRRHERAAHKAWQRWYSQHRRMVGPAYNGHRARRPVRAPHIALRLRFHL